MKKMIMVAIFSIIVMGSVFGQITVNTLSISAAQDTSCVGSSVNVQYSISNTTSSPLTYGNITFRVQFNNMTSPTIIGTTPVVTSITIPAMSTTTVSTVVGVLPSVANGSYDIRVKMYNSMGIAVYLASPTVPNKIYVLNTLITPTITASGPTAICPSTSVTLMSSGTGPYLWSSGQTTQNINVSTANTYYVTQTNQCGSVVSNSITVTQIPLPTISVSGATVGCGSVNLTSSATNYTTINWSNSQTGTTATATTTGSYYATAVNSCGSVVSNTISVTVNSIPTISAVASNSVLCAGQTDTLTASGANTYSWSTGATTSVTTTSPTTNTTYTVIGTDLNGCSNSSTVSVVVNSLPIVSAVTSNPVLCIGQFATLTASGANTYSWSTSATTNAISVSPTTNTTYTVIGTSINGCVDSATITQNVTTCTGVEDINSNSQISNIYPVPATDVLNVELQNVNNNSKFVINIYSIEGKKVYSTEYNNNQNTATINVVDFAPGVYSLEVVSDNYKSAKRIVIAH